MILLGSKINYSRTSLKRTPYIADCPLLLRSIQYQTHLKLPLYSGQLRIADTFVKTSRFHCVSGTLCFQMVTSRKITVISSKPCEDTTDKPCRNTLRAETFAWRKKLENFDKNFREWRFLGQISRKKLPRKRKKVNFCVKKLSRMARSKKSFFGWIM